MIQLQPYNSGQCLILAPNRSANWQANKLLILVMSAICIAIATGFAMIGAWMILPFAGLEIVALSSALYWVNWHLQYRQVLWIDEGKLRIEKGYYKPKQEWQWPLNEAAIYVTEHQRDPLEISLIRGSTNIRIGEFLNTEDSYRLLHTLKSLGLHTRNYSAASNLQA